MARLLAELKQKQIVSSADNAILIRNRKALELAAVVKRVLRRTDVCVSAQTLPLGTVRSSTLRHQPQVGAFLTRTRL